MTEIPIFMPKNALPAGTQLPSIDEIVTMIATANAHTRRAIVQVRANPGRNPQDAFWASTKGMANFRSFMTAGSDGIVDIYPQTGPTAVPGLRKSVEHESGHVVSQKAWGDNTAGPEVGAVARGDAQGRLLGLDVREVRASPTTSRRRGRCSWRSRAPSARRRSRR